MIPTFARVRVVKIVKYNDALYLVCSCGYFDRFGLVYAPDDLPKASASHWAGGRRAPDNNASRPQDPTRDPLAH
jgi:hypothetical protein